MSELIHLNSDYLETLMALENLCFDSPWRSERLNDYLIQSPRKLALGLIDNDLIGFAIFSLILDEAELLQIAVSPDKQRKGHALSLISDSLEFLKERNVGKVMLEVNSTNLPAIELYKRIGFIQDGIRKGYYPSSLPGGGREDAILMSYLLN